MVNMGCLRRLPDTVYVHFLLFRQQRRLIIRPSAEESRDVIRWCTPSGKPRRILCDEDFWNDITALMGWDNRSRYRLLGRFVHGSDWDGFAFDMTRAKVFSLEGIESEPEITILPCQTWEEHCRNPLVSRIEEDTMIIIDGAK